MKMTILRPAAKIKNILLSFASLFLFDSAANTQGFIFLKFPLYMLISELFIIPK